MSCPRSAKIERERETKRQRDRGMGDRIWIMIMFCIFQKARRKDLKCFHYKDDKCLRR